MAGDADDLNRLLARTAVRDRAAFARLYALTRRDLFAVAFRILRSREVAEETLQDAFVNIWNAAGDFRPSISQARTWLVSIVRNRALDVLRSERKHPRWMPVAATLDAEDGAVQIAASDPSPHELFVRAMNVLGIRQCMGDLEGAPRQALAFAYYRGLSHSEIALQMRAPIGSVKGWVRRGLERLKRCLEAAGLE